MANSLGNSSLTVSVAGGQLVSGLGKAKGDITKWAGESAKEANSKLAGIGMKGAKGGAGGMLAGLGKAAVPLAAAAAGAFTLGEALGTIDEKSKMLATAKTFGIDPSEFSAMSGVAKAAGSDLRDYTESLVSMSTLGQNAAAGTEEAAIAFKKLGLNAKDFNALSMDQKYYAAQEALSKVASAADRAALAGKLWGEDGMKSQIPLIGKSAEELKKMGEAYRVSTEKLERMNAANKAVKGLGQLWERVWTTAVAILSPVIEMVGSRLTAALTAVSPILEWCGRVGASVFGIIVDVIGEVVSIVWEAITSVGKWAGDLLGVTGTATTVESVLTGVFRAVGIAGAYCWDVIKVGAGAVAAGAGVIVSAYGSVLQAINEVLQLAKKLPDNVRPKWIDSMVDAHKEGADRIKQAGEDMKGWGVGTLNNFGKSADDVRKWFDKRGQEKKAEEEKKLKDGPASDIEKDKKKKGKSAENKAMLDGSKEAYNAIIGNKQDQFLKRAADQQVKELKEIKGGIKQLAAAVGGGLILAAG